MIEQNLIQLNNIEIIIDNSTNAVYIDFKLGLEESFEKSKKLQNFFNKNIVFKFAGDYYEVNQETTIEQIKNIYEYRKQIHNQNHVNKIYKNAINRLNQSNAKQTLKELYKELFNNKDNKNYKSYIRVCDQKQFSSKLYRMYKQQAEDKQNELLFSRLEMPKVKINKKVK